MRKMILPALAAALLVLAANGPAGAGFVFNNATGPLTSRIDRPYFGNPGTGNGISYSATTPLNPNGVIVSNSGPQTSTDSQTNASATTSGTIGVSATTYSTNLSATSSNTFTGLAASQSSFIYNDIVEEQSYFTVTDTKAYNLVATSSTSSRFSGTNTSLGIAEVIVTLYDTTTQVNLGIYNRYARPDGASRFVDTLPSQLTLVAGDVYSLYTSATAINEVFGVGMGTLSEESSLSFSITSADATPSVPEPSSLVLTGIAGLMGVAHAWRRRKAKLAA